MKRLVSICLLFVCLCSFGQFSNDWIDYGQKYYRIPITSKGVYKITYADLVANGISVGDFDHRNLQIIHNGAVLPLFVSAQPDGIFRSSDFIEFYAEGGNDGWLDSKVYYNSKPFNEAYSLYNDTASYFLTIANTLESPRYDTSRNTNYGSYTPAQYCLTTVRSNYTSTFNETKASPYIYPAEGWCDAFFDMGGNVTKTLITPNYASVNVPSEISFGIGGFSETQHDIVVTLESDESFRFDTTYYDYSAIHKIFTSDKPLSAVTTLKFQSIAGDKTADKNSVSYVQVTYPSTFNFSNKNLFEFTLPEVSEGDYILLEISSFNAGGVPPIIYCPDLKKRILTTASGGTYKALIPNVHKKLECVMVSQNAMKKVSEIRPIQSQISKNATQFLDFSQESNQGTYIIITEKSLWYQAVLYKQYRVRTGESVVLVDVDELYNQFAYGVRKHPYAISAFIDYAVKNWGITPKHVFIIGKGFHLTAYRNNETMYKRTLVPSMGNPSSDILLTLSPHGSSLKTNIAIGRLAAETPNEVAIYRKKVMDFESQEPNPWMKNVLHFGGGTTAYEQSLFRYYLNRYALTLKGEYFGADVHSFYKESSNVYETTEPEAIRKYMNEGTSLMIFFGHASGSGFDQNIDHPSLFNNQGRYPLILANSCYSGDIFADNDYNVSKIWTFAEDRGSIGFLANVDVGVPAYLNLFASSFVRNIAYSNYGNSIGSSLAKAMTDLSGRNIIYNDLYDGVTGFTLQGDPAVKLHSFEKPDLSVDESSVFFTPSVITTDMETAEFNVAVVNKGRAFSSEYSLKATFESANGFQYVIDTVVYGSYCRDTMTYVLNLVDFESGEYTVTLEVDCQNEIEEVSEDNNSVQVKFFVSSRDVLPVYPENYAIIPTDTVTLRMSSVDAFNPPAEILVEFDTCSSYDSPVLQTARIKVEGKSLVSWKPEINFIDSTTYFWRVTTADADSAKWNESSFTYEKGKRGWGQIHRHQFVNNTLTHMEYNDTTKKYSFSSVPHEITLETRGNCSTKIEYYECKYSIDATMKENTGFPENAPALHVVVLDSVTLEPWLSSRNNYGQRNYPSANGRVRFHLAFPANNVTAQRNLAKLLLDTVPVGNYIFCYSYVNPYCQSWDQSLKDAMDSLGFSAYKTTPDNYPYIFYTQKGYPSSCEEVVGTSEKDLIRFRKILTANHNEGHIRTANVGPAKSFGLLQWNKTLHDEDNSYLTIFGVTNSDDVYALRNEFLSQRDLDTLINTDNFPSLQLDCYMTDPARTPADLNYWKLYYTPAMELAVTPEHEYSFYEDTLQQGDVLRITVSAHNVSSSASDSVLIMYEIRNSHNELVYSTYKRVTVAPAYGYIVDTHEIPTNLLDGLYTLKVEFNPVDPETGEYDQPEFNHFNNTYYQPFFVKRDETAPVIDVVVDGRHLMNGDLISAQPTIAITVFDENQFFMLTDTSLVTVSIKNMETGAVTPYYFASDILKMIPAEDNENICRVLFSPELLAKGVYELHIQANDVSGNKSSSQEYVIQFVIESETKVSTLYNYPNPCSDFTTFRFVLTGLEVPKNVSIVVSDSKGRIVREIFVPNAHIGTNVLDVYWDGRDNAGNELPNGVYFYSLHFDDESSWENLPLKQTKPLNKKTGRLLINR